MALNLYNTKSKKVEVFTPIKEGVVTMYACGITVNNYTHIGHMRKYIGDDILRRTLELIGYKVNHVMNITDVGHLTDDGDDGDDKLEKGAEREGKTAWDIAKFYTDYFHNTMNSVNVLPPTHETKATEHIKEMIELVEILLKKGFAYETDQAIYFDVSKDKEYGKLSGQKLSDKLIGVREAVITDTEKHNPADFSLWFKRIGKFADHSMYWPSPWGDGFPGWHIECSAMSMSYLGETIDIHTGGIEHIPVHHENEIAQSECATGKEFVRFWVHYEMLLINGEKMSKSKGNSYTIEDIRLKNINPLAVRILTMQTSYRKTLNFTWESLFGAEAQLKKLISFSSIKENTGTKIDIYEKQFTEALCDDINTAKALSVVWEMISDEKYSRGDRYATLMSFDQVLGLDLSSTPEFTISEEAQDLLVQMNTAREQKDYQKSDDLRHQLESLGYKVEQTPIGSKLLPFF